jgi:hypothetical protein
MTNPANHHPDGGAEKAWAAEAAARALRDEMLRTAGWLEAGPTIRLVEIRERLLPRCEAVAGCNLGREIRGGRAQLDAMVQRVQGLASAHPKPMPANPLGPPTPGSCGTWPYLSQLLAPAGEGERG